MVINGIGDVEMPDNNNITTQPVTESSIYTSDLFSTTTTTQNVTTTSTDENSEETIWTQYGVIIISVTCVVIVLLLIFIISMALFIKWKSKRRTEGTYNPSRAERQEHLKNKPVFAIPLPTPERLI